MPFLHTVVKAMKRTYSELIKLPTFKERYEYLKLEGKVAEETFGFDRYLNQKFYHSADWKRVRNEIITRDLGCDLGVTDRMIYGKIYIHHMNPLTVEDVTCSSDYLLNPEYLISTSKLTHDAIHYSNDSILYQDPIVRKPNDTCPWLN